ncbi:hypothetical protein [Pseudorhodoferax sp.]|uniref:hypothetical protein n=1 Tax=Pseudorhodoferax sp. TaxID=1993553 RepID=UPI002DD6B4C7|nr:hypothetical protein [Pseudorhodoferax sp.]
MAAIDQLQSLPPALSVVVWLYLLTNAARVFTYLPQILAVWRDTQGARTLSLLTWGSWTVSHVCALAYALLVANDTPLALISAINLAGCSCITAIATRRRMQWRRSLADAAPGRGGRASSAPCPGAQRPRPSRWPRLAPRSRSSPSA